MVLGEGNDQFELTLLEVLPATSPRSGDLRVSVRVSTRDSS